MYCPYCRTQVANDIVFCPECGANLRDEQSAVDVRQQPMPPQASPQLDPNAYPQSESTQPQKQTHRLQPKVVAIIILAAIALIAIVALVIVLVTRRNEPSSEAVEAAKAIEAPTPTEIDSIIEESAPPAEDATGTAQTDSAATGAAQTEQQNTETPDSSTAQKPEEATKTTKDFNAKGVVLQVPKLWLTMDLENGSSAATPYNGSQMVYVEHIAISDVGEIDLVDLAVACALGDGGGKFTNIEIIGEPTLANVDNGAFEAVRVEYKSDIDDTTSHYMAQWIKTPNTYLVVEVSSDEADWESSKEELMQVLDSLHIEDPSTVGTDNGYVIHNDMTQA